MSKAEQTIVLPNREALELRTKVAELARTAINVLENELGTLAEAGITYDENGNPLSSLTEWAKTFKILADQVRRDNPTEHLVERTKDSDPESTTQPEAKPSLKGVKLRIAQ